MAITVNPFDFLGIGAALVSAFGADKLADAARQEEEKVKLIQDMKHCDYATALRYYRAWQDYHQNDLSLQTAVDISHRPDESQPYTPVEYPNQPHVYPAQIVIGNTVVGTANVVVSNTALPQANVANN